MDGYAPIFAYLGQEGYAVNTELREGSTHSQKDATEFLEEIIVYARHITDERILVRMDASNDSFENLKTTLSCSFPSGLCDQGKPAWYQRSMAISQMESSLLPNVSLLLYLTVENAIIGNGRIDPLSIID